MMGVAVGNIGAMWGLIKLTKNLDPKLTFGIFAGVTVFFSIILSFIIKEPKIERSYQNESFLKKTFKLLKLTIHACKENGNLALGFIFVGIFATEPIMLTFSQSFLNTLVDPN